MAYKMVTKVREDGSQETYKEYHRSHIIAFILGMLGGGIGLHFLYARNFTLFWVMIILFAGVAIFVPYDSNWSYLTGFVGFLTAFHYLFMGKDKFFRAVNGYDE